MNTNDSKQLLRRVKNVYLNNILRFRTQKLLSDLKLDRIRISQGNSCNGEIKE